MHGYKYSLIIWFIIFNSGLYNDALSLHLPFNENVADLCETFFKQLHPPTCVLAHNGSKFDFPLLVAELNRIGRKMPEGILCADTLKGFRDILSMTPVKEFLSKTLSPPKPSAFRSSQPGPSRSSDARSRRNEAKELNRHVMGPSDITPEMQLVKSCDFGNAPKKKLFEKEPSKEGRVVTARRKLNFGSPPAGAGENDVDDVDVEDVMASLNGWSRVTPDNSSSPGSSDAPQSGPISQNTIPFSFQMESISDVSLMEDISDTLLLEAVEELEKSAQEAVESHEPVPSTSSSSPSVKTWAQVLQSEPSLIVAGKDQTDRNHNRTHLPTPPKTEVVPTTPPNTLNPHADSGTPTSGQKQFLDSFPTPSPSPHKMPEEEDAEWPMLVSPYSPVQFSANPNSGPGKNRPQNSVGFSLALPSIHRRVTGFDPKNSHSAEDDCMSLLRIAQKLSPWFCTWVDTHNSEFSTVAPLYNAAKRPKKQ